MPLLSVIVPTHDRAKYAVPTIKSVLEISDDIQVIVSDSSPIDGISASFENFSDTSRLKIIRPKTGVSVVDNFNFALAAADGEYLVFIGDDDFVSPEIVSVAAWAKSQNVDALKLNFPVLYYWPDFKHATRGDSYAGTLHVAPFTGKITPHNARAALDHACDNFGGGVFEMPRAYAGMLSSKLAKNIAKKYGALFGGVSPDIYSSALISSESQKCVAVDFPLVIPGASGGSTTGQSAAGGHRGKLRENAHIAAFPDLVWDARIPEFYSVPTVWSYSLLKAVDKISKQHPERQITPDFGRLLLKCFAYHRNEKNHTMDSLAVLRQQYGSLKITGQFLRGIAMEFVWGMSRIKQRIVMRHVKNNIAVLSELETTQAARQALTDYITQHQKILAF